MRVVLPDGRDLAVNYGIFDFDSPNFIYRFRQGGRPGLHGGCFIPSAYSSKVTCATDAKWSNTRLPFDAGETSALLELLSRNLMPDKRVYRYNYVKGQLLDASVPGSSRMPSATL